MQILAMMLLAACALFLPWVVLFMVLSLRSRCDRLEGEVSKLRRLLVRLEGRLDGAEPGPDRAVAYPPPGEEGSAEPTPDEPGEPDEPEPVASPESDELKLAEPLGPPITPKAGGPAEEAVRRMAATLGRRSASGPDEPPEPSEPSGPGSAGGPEPAASWEERLGARLPVWIGAVALALAGVFLVRHFAQRGLFGPAVQVGLAGAFGLAMLGGGEWLRLREARIAQGLTAAGVAVLYAAVLAAVSLHGLIGPTAGFVLMAGVTAGAVALSMRQGVFVALLGLVGGFLMPGLLGAGDVSVVQLFGYLLLLEIGLTVLTRTRRWWSLTLLTMLGGFGWAALWLALWYDPAESTAVGLFVLASIAAFVFASIDTDERIGEARVSDALPYGAVAAGLLLVGWLIRAAEFSTLEWAYLGLLGSGCLVLGRLRARYAPMAWLAAGMGLFLLLNWAGRDGAVLGERFNWIVLAFGVLWGGGAYGALWGAVRPAGWAWLSVLAAVGHMLVGYWFAEASITALPWWVVSLLLAGGYTAASVPVGLRRRWMVDGDDVLTALLVGAIAFVTLAGSMELERQWLSVAWAVEVPLIALLGLWLRLPWLPCAVAVLAALAAVRLLLNPSVLQYPIGEHWLWNWLLYGYGVPILAFAAAAWLVRRGAEERLASCLEAGAIAMGFVMVTLMIHHGFHPRDMSLHGIPLFECGTLSAAWGLLGLALLGWARWRPRPVRTIGGQVITMVGITTAVCGSGLLANPLWNHEAIGATPIFNGLLYLYVLPAIIALVAAWRFRRTGPPSLAMAAALGGLLLVFCWVTLSVRQAFHGTYLDGPTPSHAEWYAYSAAWILFAAVLLAIGVVRRGRVLRYASLAVMLVSILKVFLFDTGHLADLWRVLSYLGLGISLLLLAWVYQRFVFGKGGGERDRGIEGPRDQVIEGPGD